MFRWLMATLVCAACSGGTPSDDPTQPDMATSNGSPDMTDPIVTNPCPNGFFKIKADAANSEAGVNLGGAIASGGGSTARNTPEAGDPWFQNVTDKTYMDTFSMSPINMSALFTLARDETARTRTLTISGSAAASAAPGVFVQSLGRLRNATVELCDPSALLDQNKQFTITYDCQGDGNGAYGESLVLQGLQVCSRSGATGVWNILSGTLKIPAPAGKAMFSLSAMWNANGGSSGSPSSQVSPTFKVTIQ